MSRGVVTATWDDAPHLSDAAKAEILSSIPPYQRAARTRGVPGFGAGAVYPVDEEQLLEDSFTPPDHWARGFSLDVGWRRTAALWGAYDRESSILHLYSEHYVSQQEPSTHAASIKARGKWIPGWIDPAAHGRSQADGKQLFQMYADLGLPITSADNGLETGIFQVWSMMAAGRLKVMRHLQNFREEFRFYRRDKKGVPVGLPETDEFNRVEHRDHLMACLRYLVTADTNAFVLSPVKKGKKDPYEQEFPDGVQGTGWMSH